MKVLVIVLATILSAACTFLAVTWDHAGVDFASLFPSLKSEPVVVEPPGPRVVFVSGEQTVAAAPTLPVDPLKFSGTVTKASDFRRPALVKAAIECDKAAVKSLVKEGVDVNETDYRGFSALAWAAQLNCLPVVDYLLAKGEDIETVSWNGYSAADWASQAGNLELSFFIKNRVGSE